MFSVRYLGSIDFKSVLRLQTNLTKQRKLNQIGDTLLLAEHTPTLLVGLKELDGDYKKSSLEKIHNIKPEVHQIGLAKGVVYRGPGQLVGYPILDFSQFNCSPYLCSNAHAYMNALQRSMIYTLEKFRIQARSGSHDSGIWVGSQFDRKIGSFALKFGNSITYNGFSLNVNSEFWDSPKLKPIHTLTSVSNEIKREVAIPQVLPHLLNSFSEVFGREFVLEEEHEKLPIPQQKSSYI